MTKPPCSGGGDVVGMALELGGQREQVGVELEEVVGGHQPRHVGGGARPQAPAERDLRLDAEGEGARGRQPGEAADGQVAPVAGDLQVGVDREAPGLLDLELHVQRERAREGVEPRAEVRARGGHADEAATAHRGGTLTAPERDPRPGRPVGLTGRVVVDSRRGRARELTERVTSPEFVGRERELAGLGAALERAADRRPAVVLVAGESGVGKTRLVAELAARARAQGARVLTGDCVDLGDGELAYAPIVSALRGPEPGRARRRRGGPRAAAAPARRPEAGDESALSQGRVFELLLAPAGAPGRGAAARARLRGRPLGRPLLARLPVLLRAQRAPPARAARRHLPHRRAAPPPSAAGAGGRGRARPDRRARRARALHARGDGRPAHGDPRPPARGAAGRRALRPRRGQPVLHRGAGRRRRPASACRPTSPTR